jgi:hypothetical protein
VSGFERELIRAGKTLPAAFGGNAESRQYREYCWLLIL